MTSQNLQLMKRYIEEISGLRFAADKDDYLELRLTELLKRFDAESYLQLLEMAKSDGTGIIARGMVEAVVVHETSFFRDQYPFELVVERLLPEVLQLPRSASPILDTEHAMPADILCAGCSFGQEVYSLAMLIDEAFPLLPKGRVRIIGVDVSAEALAIAREGFYSQLEVTRGVSPERVERHFTPFNGGWKIRAAIGNLTHFIQHDLLHPFTMLGCFDVILCRNVARHLSKENRRKLFNNLSASLRVGGRIIVGSSESIELSRDEILRRVSFRGQFYYEKIKEK